MNQPPALKTCPFCGGSRLKLVHDPMEAWLDRYFILCRDDSVFGPIEKNSEAAIAAWNRRAQIVVLDIEQPSLANLTVRLDPPEEFPE